MFKSEVIVLLTMRGKCADFDKQIRFTNLWKLLKEILSLTRIFTNPMRGFPEHVYLFFSAVSMTVMGLFLRGYLFLKAAIHVKLNLYRISRPLFADFASDFYFSFWWNPSKRPQFQTKNVQSSQQILIAPIQLANSCNPAGKSSLLRSANPCT